MELVLPCERWKSTFVISFLTSNIQNNVERYKLFSFFMFTFLKEWKFEKNKNTNVFQRFLCLPTLSIHVQLKPYLTIWLTFPLKHKYKHKPFTEAFRLVAPAAAVPYRSRFGSRRLFSFFLSFSTPSAFHQFRGYSRGWKFVSPNILA